MAYKNPAERREYMRQWRKKRRDSGYYGQCKECGSPLGRNESTQPYATTGYCSSCHKGDRCSFYRGGYKNHDGYIVGAKGRLQHRIIMEEELGRPLYPGETVHHKNGVSDDNRIDNLELWVGAIWSGVRVNDAVDWAKEILRRYDV